MANEMVFDAHDKAFASPRSGHLRQESPAADGDPLNRAEHQEVEG